MSRSNSCSVAEPISASRFIARARCSMRRSSAARWKACSAGSASTSTPVPDAHLCCGSAGTYSFTQPELARKLRDNKLDALESGKPEVIVTANIGCQTHLGASGTHAGAPLDRDRRRSDRLKRVAGLFESPEHF